MSNLIPPYFDFLIDSFDPEYSDRFVHLGYWDQPNEAIENTPETFSLAQKRLNEQFIQLAELSDHQKVLDVGCGFGGTLQSIDSQHNHMQLHGVNIDERQLEICSQLKPSDHNQYQWQKADACTLPYPDASFDRVISLEAMFHFSSRLAFLKEVYRVLKPGGLFVATDIVIDEKAAQQNTPGFLLEASIADGYGPWPDFWHTEGSHQELAKQCGLSVKQYVDATAQTLPSHHFTTPSQASEQYDSGNPAIRSALALSWLHRNNLMQYPFMQLSKEA